MRRAILSGALVLSLTGVGGCSHDSTDPTAVGQPEYSAIHGVYDVAAPITVGLPGARLEGTMTFTQPPSQLPGFAGSFAVEIVGPAGERSNTFTGSLAGHLTRTGEISFNFLDDTRRSEHRWTGTVNGASLAGTWYLVAPDGSGFRGTFTAVRR